MDSQNEFNVNLRKIIANSIPCIHMNTLLISERVLKSFKNYLLECKENNLSTIDDVISHMENKNGTTN